MATPLTIGIDLGTTNSCAAYHDGRSSQIIETLDGTRLMPSVISLYADGRLPLVGRPAQNALHANYEYTFKHIKRHIGQEWNEQEHGHFQLLQGPNGEVWFNGPDRKYSPAELSSYIIKALTDAAEHKIGRRPDGVVVTVPANFDDRQIAATREAAVKAGYSVKKVTIMHEPAMAALAYGIDQSKFATVAVFDLGGGTFDISIMRCGANLNRTLGLDGHSNLGGIDFDERLVDHLVDRWSADHGDDLRAKELCMIRLRDACEQAKIMLTTQPETTVYLDSLTVDEAGIHNMRYDLTQSLLVELTSDLIARSIDICRRAVQKAAITVSDIDHVILVGGMTRVPAVIRGVQTYFGREAKRGIVPEEVVAIGAATYAAMIDKRIGGSKFANIAPVSTGFEAASGVMTVMIPRGSSTPTRKKVILTTDEDNQTTCSVRIVQGEQPGARDNTHILTYHVPVDPAPAGEASVEVECVANEEGALQIIVDGESIYGAIE